MKWIPSIDRFNTCDVISNAPFQHPSTHTYTHRARGSQRPMRSRIYPSPLHPSLLVLLLLLTAATTAAAFAFLAPLPRQQRGGRLDGTRGGQVRMMSSSASGGNDDGAAGGSGKAAEEWLRRIQEEVCGSIFVKLIYR